MGKQYVIYRFTKPNDRLLTGDDDTLRGESPDGSRLCDGKYCFFCRLSLDEYSRRDVVVVDVNDRRI